MDRDMCMNPKCVLKHNCLRHMGKADIVQSYTNFTPTRNTETNFYCIGYIALDSFKTNKKNKRFNFEQNVRLDDEKQINGFSNYYISSNGTVYNAKINKIITQKNFDGVMYTRLLKEDGSVKFIKIQDLLLKYHNFNQI